MASKFVHLFLIACLICGLLAGVCASLLYLDLRKNDEVVFASMPFEVKSGLMCGVMSGVFTLLVLLG